MREYSVIYKGTYPRSGVDNFLSVAQYLIVEKNGKRFLLLKLSNDREEAATGVKLSIRQTDSAGAELGSQIVEARVKNGKPHTRFVLSARIPLEKECSDCVVQVLSADFGAYTYSVKDGALIVSYCGKPKREKKSAEEYLEKTGGSKFSVRSRSVKAAVIALSAFLTLAVVLGVTFWQLQIFKKEARGFRQSGIEYQFVNLANREESPIRVTGYKGRSKRVVIPQEIEGHTVVEIAPYAFENNDRIERVSFLFQGEVQFRAFSGCKNLTDVFFGEVSRIASSAFENCSALKEVTAVNLEYIGDYAFQKCTSLSRVRLSGSDKTVEIGEFAFSFCQRLSDVDIDRFIRYPSNGSVFNACGSITSLHLKNYNYKSSYYGGYNQQTLLSLFGFYQPGYLERLRIEYIDEISDWFCSDLQYLRWVEIGTLSSSRIGMGAFQNCSNLTSFIIPNVTEVGDEAFRGTSLDFFDGQNLQAIGARAFYDCPYLRDLNLQWNESLTYVGDGAFAGCLSLTELRFPDSVSLIGWGVFQGCENLKQLTLPFLGRDAYTEGLLGYFFGALNVSNQGSYIPSSLAEVYVTNATQISSYAFSGCSSLARVFLNPQITLIGKYAFADCASLEYVTFGDALTEIGPGAFTACQALTSIRLPDTLNKIGSGAFSGCSSVSEMQIPFVGGDRVDRDTRFFAYIFGGPGYWDSYVVPQSLGKVVVTDETEIPAYAFGDCSALREVVLYQGVESIGKFAFSNCWKIKQLSIPSSVKSIENDAFSSCYRLLEICNYSALDIRKGEAVANGGVGSYALNVYGRTGVGAMPRTKIGGYEFAKAEDGWYLTDYKEASALSLPERFEGLGGMVNSYRVPYGLFAYDQEIERLKISKAVDYLGDYAFIGARLTSVAFADDSSLKEIREGTFAGCEQLREATLPAGIERLGESSFSQCRSLPSFTVGAAVSEIGKQAFYGCTNLYEVYNYSRLHITKGSTDNGYVAYYALAVMTSPQGENVREVTADGKVYKTWGDAWYLIAYTGSAEELTLGSFECDGKKVDSYAVLQNVFFDCGSLVRVHIGKEVTAIGEYAFQNCYNLTEVVFDKESRVSRIEKGAFASCEYLTRIELPPALESIGESAFIYCHYLERLALPKSMREIGEMAFYDCQALKRIYNLSSLPLKKGNTDYGYVAYYATEILDSLDEGAETLRAA